MTIDVKILADSENPVGDRLTTFQLTYPRFIHAQLMTHREFSRNAASSRAIPTKTMIERIEEDPVEPVHWGKNKKGMQAGEELAGPELYDAKFLWDQARDHAINFAQELADVGCHKQVVNRLLEPFMHITVIVSATEYENWYAQRCAHAAQPEIYELACKMRDAQRDNMPDRLVNGQWHTPLVSTDPWDPMFVDKEAYDVVEISTARCARVSYLTHDGQRSIDADVALYKRLETDGHWSPFEHVARAMATSERSGNFVGFHQYRKMMKNEYRGRKR